MKKSNARIYISSEVREFYDFIHIAKKKGYGIEIQSFAMPEIMYGNWLRELTSYKKELSDFNNGIAFHNPFLSTVTVSPDYKVVDNTREKMKYGFMVAKELGAKYVIAHFYWWPYYKGDFLDIYVEEQLKFWDEFIDFAEKEDIIIVMENTTEPSPDYIIPIVEKANSPNFQINWDVGHANVFSEISIVDWIPAIKDYLKYIHYHNNDGSCDQHSWNNRGNINFEPIFKKLSELNIHPIITTEVYKKEELLKALNFIENMKKKYSV